MNATARLDPRTKHNIKQALEAAMYAATGRRFDKKLADIITANTVACKFDHASFSYKGEFYTFELKHPRFKNQRLMASLHPAMDEYLADKKHLEYTEKPYVIGFFTKLLNLTNSIDDYLAVLPDCMHRTIRMLVIPPELYLPRELSDEQVEQFKADHHDWIFMLKKRMVLDLVL